MVNKQTKNSERGFSGDQWLRVHLACRGHWFDPWSGKIPHATEQLSPCTATVEPMGHDYSSLCTQSLCSVTGEALQ